MNVKEVAQWLLDNAYMMLVSGKPVLTAKFDKELGYVVEVPTLSSVKETITVSVPITSGEAIKRLSDPKDVWNAFIHDADIPHRVKATDGSTYTVRQYGTNVARKLQKIIQDPAIDYWKLVEATKNYYKVTTYKQLLSNYIAKDIWKHEYSEWLKGNKQQIQVSDGGSRWESD